jgi:dephospho-CoA kinase
MLMVGLTGGIASGKSTVGSMLRERGATILDADKVGHRVLLKGSDAYGDVIATFGSSVLADDGEIDRKKLGAIVFADPAKLEQLNAISHPRLRQMMIDEVEQIRAEGSTEVLIVDAALLFEAGWEVLCDESWVVFVPEAIAVERLIARNGLTAEQALSRIRSQMPIEEKRGRGDVVIENDGTLDELERKVDAEWQGALRRARGEAPRMRATVKA